MDHWLRRRLIGRLVQRQVPGRVVRAVDLDLVKVEQDRLGARNLQSYETCLQVAGRKSDFQRRSAGDAAEVSSLIVVSLCPVRTVVRSQNVQRIGIVQAGCVVESVVDNDAWRWAECYPRSTCHQGMRIAPRVKGILAILHAIDRSRRVALRRQRLDSDFSQSSSISLRC